MTVKTALTDILNIDFPIIMAPMFLVSNLSMLEAGIESGIAAAFPSLNYRKDGELAALLDQLNNKLSADRKGTYGVNLIVQKSNPLYSKQLKVCVEKKVPFYITSLGNPKEVIDKAHSYGAKVFCDVTNIEHAKKVASLGCDGFIAVGQGAGGHAGPYPLQILIASLKNNFPEIPVIAAGGISSGSALLSVLASGAEGASIGTRFIACKEASVSDAYKNAIVDAKMSDIVLTEKLSGTPCTIINTSYAKKIGTKQNFFERLLSNNKTTKKYFKMLVQLKGMKNLEKSIKPGSYKTLWCAGQSVELIDEIQSCASIIEMLKLELQHSKEQLNNKF